MRLAVIPARGGSKRIPRKNVRPFAGRPMIAYAIGAALSSGIFDRVLVSTDDDEIARIAQSEGAEVPFRRPGDLADDTTPTVPVIAHAIRVLQEAGAAPKEVCCIYPGVPFIQVQDLHAGLERLQQGDTAYVFPVTTFPSPIQRALKRNAAGVVQPFFPEYVNTRTQDLEPSYHDAGQFYWGHSRAWLAGLSLHGHASALILPEWRVVDIDTEADWQRAEMLYRMSRERKEL